MFDANDRAFGGVDVVVSNAGGMHLVPFRDMSDAEFDRMVAVNIKGGFNGLREAARRVRDGGRIIANVVSVLCRPEGLWVNGQTSVRERRHRLTHGV